jgi:hypothetical protein
VGALGVDRVSGHDRVGELDAVQKLREQRDFVGLGLDIDLAQDHPMGVVERGQQMPTRLGVAGRTTQGLTVDTDPTTRSRCRAGAFAGPGPETLVQEVGVQALQGPAERRLTRHDRSGANLGQGERVGVARPLADRDVGPGPGQDRADRQGEYC